MKQRPPQPAEETLWLKSADKAGGAASAEDEEAVDDPLGDPLGESDDAAAQGWSCNKCAFRERSLETKLPLD